MPFTDAPLYFPSLAKLGRNASNGAISSTNAIRATICYAPKTGSISTIKFSTRNVPTGSTFQMRVETVDSSGNPTGTLVNAGATGTVVIGDADDFVYKECTLGTPASVTAGDLIAATISYSSGVTPNMNLFYSAGILAPTSPHSVLWSGSSWANTTTTVLNTMFKYVGDTEYQSIDGIIPARDVDTGTFNSSSSPNEKGNKFVAPFSGRATSAHLFVNTVNPFDVVLYDENTNVLATASVNGAAKSANGPIVARFKQNYVDIKKGRTYRLTQKPTSTSNVGQYFMVDVEFPVLGLSPQQIQYTSRTGSGSWTDVSTDVYSIALGFSGIRQSGGRIS
mgnify:CR=1 FL=1